MFTPVGTSRYSRVTSYTPHLGFTATGDLVWLRSKLAINTSTTKPRGILVDKEPNTFLKKQTNLFGHTEGKTGRNAFLHFDFSP